MYKVYMYYIHMCSIIESPIRRECVKRKVVLLHNILQAIFLTTVGERLFCSLFEELKFERNAKNILTFFSAPSSYRSAIFAIL